MASLGQVQQQQQQHAAPLTMWYAHNYAQRRSNQARSASARAQASHHPISQHTLPYNPYPLCHDHLSGHDYANTVHQYLADYTLHHASYPADHAPAAPIHTHGKKGAVATRSRGQVMSRMHGLEQDSGVAGLVQPLHTSSRNHAFSIDQSHALTAEQGHAFPTAEHIFTSDQSLCFTADRSHVYEEPHAFTGYGNHVYASLGPVYSEATYANQGRTYDSHLYGEQSHPYEEREMYRGDDGLGYGEGCGRGGQACLGGLTEAEVYYQNVFPHHHHPEYGSSYPADPAMIVSTRSRAHHRDQQQQQQQLSVAQQSALAQQDQQQQMGNLRGKSGVLRSHGHRSSSSRSSSRDLYSAFYPESAASSDHEEERVLDDDIRVDLPYTHFRCRGRSGGGGVVREDIGSDRGGTHFVRRYPEGGETCDEDGEVSTVGLSYQQRDTNCTTRGHPTLASSLGLASEGEEDRGASRRLLLAEGLVREWVRAVGVVAASGTLVTLVVLGFGVYNMLITTLFLLFVLTTVALLIFLLMRRPPCCCPCCHDPYDAAASSAHGSTGSQAANITYLTESHGIVVKKWLKDSPPPYESPPEYSSLSPELIMDAKTLQELVASTPAAPPPRAPSPVCTTPLFTPNYCDTPRSLTPTMQLEEKLYDPPPSPAFPDDSPCHSLTYVAQSSPSSSLPSAAAGSDQRAPPSPPAYESLRLYEDGGRRKEGNQ